MSALRNAISQSAATVAGVRDVPRSEDAGVQLDQRDGDRAGPQQQSAADPAVDVDGRRQRGHRARIARARTQHGHHRPGQRAYTVKNSRVSADILRRVFRILTEHRLRMHDRELRYFVDLRIRTLTEPVPLKCGKVATQYPWIYGYFTAYSIASLDRPK